MKIAFLEDDINFAAMVVEWLQEAGHQVDLFSSGHECLRAFNDRRYALCLFDWSLPDMEGVAVMESLKLKGKLPPVIFLTGHDAEEDVMKVLNAGADDYIVKPPHQSILLARINAVARRSYPSSDPADVLKVGNLEVDFKLRKIKLNQDEVKLTDKENELALYILANQGALLPRVHLLQVVWGSTANVDTRTIDVHISHLRSKLGLLPENGWRLSSIYQQGYRLERLTS